VIHYIEAVRIFFSRMNLRRLALPCLCAFALIASARLSAQSTDATPTQRARTAPVLTIYFENDVFYGTDRHYTA
jgi:hypothetical protein